VQRTAIVLLALLVTTACGGSAPSSPAPVTSASPTSNTGPSPTPTPTANPALTIFDRSQAVMATLGYTVNRQWLKPQPQTLAPVQWKPGQAPEMTMVVIDSPVYSFSSTTDTSPRCPNTICYVVRVAGTQHGSPSSCSPPVLISADVYIDGTTFRNLSRHVLGSGGGGSGCQPVDLEGWDSITFP
jgi:hypothetical protein